MCSNLDVCRGADRERFVQEGVEGGDLVCRDGGGVGAEEPAAEGCAGDRDGDSGSHGGGGGGGGGGCGEWWVVSGEGEGDVCVGEGGEVR